MRWCCQTHVTGSPGSHASKIANGGGAVHTTLLVVMMNYVTKNDSTNHNTAREQQYATTAPQQQQQNTQPADVLAKCAFPFNEGRGGCASNLSPPHMGLCMESLPVSRGKSTCASEASCVCQSEDHRGYIS